MVRQGAGGDIKRLGKLIPEKKRKGKERGKVAIVATGRVDGVMEQGQGSGTFLVADRLESGFDFFRDCQSMVASFLFFISSMQRLLQAYREGSPACAGCEFAFA